MNNVKLLPVKNKKILEEHGVYFSPGTLRRWHCQRIHPEIFTKVGGLLFINFNEWQKLIAQKTRLAKKTAKKIQELGYCKKKVQILRGQKAQNHFCDEGEDHNYVKSK